MKLSNLSLRQKVKKNKVAKNNKGFTLVEMIVVIGIIAVISGIILMSLTQAKSQSRDKKRVSDIRSLQLNLEYYYNQHNFYPTSTSGLIGVSLPKDPLTAADYSYISFKKISGGRCSSYHLGAKLENANAEYLGEDKDFDSRGITASSGLFCGGAGFYGSDIELYYDVTPTY